VPSACDARQTWTMDTKTDAKVLEHAGTAGECSATSVACTGAMGRLPAAWRVCYTRLFGPKPKLNSSGMELRSTCSALQ
jgi:hypothetical protein